MDSKAFYALAGIFSFFIGIILFFIDGMLFWSIGFFSLGIILVLFRMIWNIAGWAENATRRFGDD